MLKMFLATAVAMFAVTGVRAEDPQFFLKSDGTVEKRLAGLEKRIADLEAKLSPAPVTAPKPTAVAAANPQPMQVVYQVCVNGRCTNFSTSDPASVPLGAKIISTTAVASGATMAAGDCPCGTYCPCASTSSYAAPADDRWFFGKNLGRKR